jgi:hypothetical protein
MVADPRNCLGKPFAQVDLRRPIQSLAGFAVICQEPLHFRKGWAHALVVKLDLWMCADEVENQSCQLPDADLGTRA